jgi:hypothetical protein
MADIRKIGLIVLVFLTCIPTAALAGNAYAKVGIKIFVYSLYEPTAIIVIGEEGAGMMLGVLLVSTVVIFLLLGGDIKIGGEKEWSWQNLSSRFLRWL